jgi:ABC-type dipeptide/oligopeptide/nickel transport system ATPase component
MSRSEAEKDAMDLYRRMQLPNPDEIGFRYPHQVSGGQLQRAMTAMAMACRPDLIIFDEPTTALDVTTQIEVLAAIRDIVEQFDTAAIYITHDLAVVAQMADKIKVLLKGEEVEEADTRTMLERRRRITPNPSGPCAASSAGTAARPKGTTPVVSVRNVTAAYGSIDVLKDISFDIHARRTVAVVGESGSGKSTTARVITGLLPPRRGEILFNGDGAAPRLPPPHARPARQAQMIYQMADTALNPKLKIRELIGRPAQMYLGLNGKALEARIKDLLSLIELEPSQLHRPPPLGAFGRPEAAHRHRPGAGRRAALHHLRRGHLRPRPACRRRHPEAARPAAGGIRPRLHVHHPRPRHGARHRRRGRRDEGGHRGREGAEGRDVPAPARPLYRASAVLGAGDGPRLAVDASSCPGTPHPFRKWWTSPAAPTSWSTRPC